MATVKALEVRVAALEAKLEELNAKLEGLCAKPAPQAKKIEDPRPWRVVNNAGEYARDNNGRPKQFYGEMTARKYIEFVLRDSELANHKAVRIIQPCITD